MTYSYVGRKLKKARIPHFMDRTYQCCSKRRRTYLLANSFTSLTQKDIDLNRKVLADLAMNEPESFQSLVASGKITDA